MHDTGARGLIEVRIKSDDRTGMSSVASLLDTSIPLYLSRLPWLTPSLTAGSRRRYAFAEFKYESDAVDYLEQHYPTLDIRDRSGEPIRIYIEYSRERRTGPNMDDWKCTLVSLLHPDVATSKVNLDWLTNE